MEPESNPLDLLRQRRAMNRVEAAMRKAEDTPKPGGYRYLGRNADTGQGLIVGNDGSVIPGDIITSGHIKPGQAVRVAQAGGMVQLDQKPRVRKVAPPVVKKTDRGPVKIVFSVIEDGRFVYYLGGDRKVPKKLFSATFAEDPDVNIVTTGKGLNQFYWQSLTYTFGEIVPTGFSGYTGVRLVDSRFPDSLFVPRIPIFTGNGSNNGDLISMLILPESLPGRAWDNDTYLASYYGEGVFGAAWATSTNFGNGIIGRTSLQFNYVIARDGAFESGTAPGGSGALDRVNPGFEATIAWAGSTSYTSDIDGIPFFGGSGAEAGTTNTPSGTIATYAGSHSKYQLMQIGSSGSLIRRGARTGYTIYDTKTFQEEIVGFSDGSYFNLGDPAMDLIRSKWISPNYSSIANGSLWVRDESSYLYIPETQDYVDFKSIDLKTGAIVAKRVKIFPIVSPVATPVYKIHSISYTP
jgi:hypothetical protein